MLVYTHLQYLITTLILPKSIYFYKLFISIPDPNQVYDKKRKKCVA